MWSAWGRIPFGLGADVIRRCISIALGRDGGIVSDVCGDVPKRNVRASGPSLPNGSIAKGMRVMLSRSRSPMTWPPLRN